MGIGGVQFDKAVGRRNRLVRFFIFVVGVGHIQLSLHGVTAERIAGFQCVEVFDRIFVIALRHRGRSLGIEPAGILGFIDLFRQQRTGGDQKRQ